ncbi:MULTISPECIES: baseplate J/gp47 family protein [Pseudomonas]|uniref:baseplate J/gp47 family protein n=1 Tax=Pseudomonas TaxID=286 RepID=UPI000876897B|nr:MULTISPECIES: baseplate J/gp47 family protein [Pseudomonas]SCZ38204.1 Phage-related baseplate assembly protein [Pseudomonas sp. NFIX46]SDB46538.1 Phage-related baseplate assembly protein [Pseudomonas putida]SFQ91835.1 Phage-related baseplate assembly protein [Pseudomonas sp. NFIX49]
MNSFVAIDLGQLPAPQIVEQIDYEQILAERKAHAISLWPVEEQAEIAARLNMESEPLTKLLEENAYRETIWRQRVNEASVANMLALAKGTDLEQLAANFNVKRLVIQAANPTAVPPLPRLMESDDSLCERAQMAWEGLSTAGPRNAYIFHARSADGQVADATAESPAPAEAVVTVQSVLGDGNASQVLLNKVKAYLSDDDRRPVGDRLTVQGAEIINYQIKAKIYPLSNGPETELVLAAAEAQLLKFVHQRRRLALEVSESIVHAALHVEGVRKVVLEDWEDIVATKYQAPYCTKIVLVLGIE